jgi:hypothetical protein
MEGGWRVDGSQSRYGFFREERNLLSLPRIEPPSFGRPPSCLIAKTAINRIAMRKRKSYCTCHVIFNFYFRP